MAVRQGFTLVELLVVIAIVSVLAAILFSVFARAKQATHRAVCISNLRQTGAAFSMYIDSNDYRMPDRRDLKQTLDGGYRPWTGWPPSDPRGGWVSVVLEPYKSELIHQCPVVSDRWSAEPRVVQNGVNYWFWRFDRDEHPVGLTNFWGKLTEQAVADLQAANDPFIGVPESEADTELAVDPYFPHTADVPEELKGKTAHFGGRNRLFLDGHVGHLRDHRTAR